MISTNDKVLSECQPPGMTWEDYMEDCEKSINMANLHSDEWSSEDEALANDERSNNERPDRLKQTNSVIKIYDKKWRSTRVRLEVILFKKVTFINHKYIFLY